MAAETERERRVETKLQTGHREDSGGRHRGRLEMSQTLSMGFGCTAGLLQQILVKGRLNMLLACLEAKLYRTAATAALSAEL